MLNPFTIRDSRQGERKRDREKEGGIGRRLEKGKRKNVEK